jgi:uncharacterized repeat protein (TIGR03803 family)
MQRIWPALFAGLVMVTLGTQAVAQESAATFTDLHDFNASAGEAYDFSSTKLAQARDGNLYLESQAGGTSSLGTVLRLSPTAAPKIILSFNGTNGVLPTGGVTLGSDGLLYGDAQEGGTSSLGVTFKVSTAGTYTALHNFTNTGDGFGPVNALVLATDGNYYGLTNSQPETFYKVTSAGVLTTLHTFSTTEGYQGGQLVQGSDGNFYGGLNLGGANGRGTLFKVTSGGSLTLLHTFAIDASDGADAAGGMVQAPNGVYFGTPSGGGANGAGVLFKVTSSGTFTLLHSFVSATDGANPGVLMLATDGNMYGVTATGGANNCGTLFKVSQAGVLSTVYNFVSTTGCNPSGYLTQDTDGKLYGVTNGGGAHGNGTFFSYDLGLSAFITLQSTSGKVGSKIGILGQGFSSSSVVKFNGAQATTVTLSGTTFITATVPAGATSGLVTVTTGSTTLTSTVKFTVHDSWSSGAAIPTPVNYPAGTGTIGSTIYMVGGATASGNIATNQTYNVTTNTWGTAAALPAALAGGSSAVVNKILYIFGGYSGTSETAVSSVWAYDPSTNAWTAKSDMPTARGSSTAVVDGTIVYVIGGNGSSLRLNTVEAYDTVANTWSTKAPLLTGKSDLGGGLLGTSVLAADGYNAATGDNGDNESYNASTNSWSVVAADPHPRNSVCYGAVGTQLYIAGGVDSSNNPLTQHESYTASSNKWTTLASEPVAAVAPGSAVANGLLYCISGSSSSALGQGTLYNNVQIYQP